MSGTWHGQSASGTIYILATVLVIASDKGMIAPGGGLRGGARPHVARASHETRWDYGKRPRVPQHRGRVSRGPATYAQESVIDFIVALSFVLMLSSLDAPHHGLRPLRRPTW